MIRSIVLLSLFVVESLATGNCAATASDVDSMGELPTLMTVRGKLLMREDFDKPIEVARSTKLPGWTQGWKTRPGKWEVVEGALKGVQVKADNHSAGCAYPLKITDAVVQFDVRLDGCRQAMFWVHDGKEHIARVVINTNGFSTQKDDHDHGGPDQAVPFGSVALAIGAGEWKTVVVEFAGEEMVVSVDGKSLAGSHPLVASEKPVIGFVVSGDSASFRSLRVWEAEPNKDWPANKARLSQKP